MTKYFKCFKKWPCPNICAKIQKCPWLAIASQGHTFNGGNYVPGTCTFTMYSEHTLATTYTCKIHWYHMSLHFWNDEVAIITYIGMIWISLLENVCENIAAFIKWQSCNWQTGFTQLGNPWPRCWWDVDEYFLQGGEMRGWIFARRVKVHFEDFCFLLGWLCTLIVFVPLQINTSWTRGVARYCQTLPHCLSLDIRDIRYHT